MTSMLLALFFAGAAEAQLPVSGRNAIASELLAETDRPAAGTELTLALLMKPDRGWHGYWKNPGDAGTETRISWSLPQGVTAGELRYPVPGRLLISGLMNYVYEKDYAQLVTLRIPAGLKAGTALPIRATLDYLACTDKVCVPERAQLALDLTVGDAGAQLARRAQFDAFRERMPKPLGSDGRFGIAAGKLRLAIPLPASAEVEDAYFFPLTGDTMSYSASQAISRSGDQLIVEVQAADAATNIRAVDGVLKIGDDQGLLLRAVPGDVPAAGEALDSGERQESRGQLILLALLGAIAGGLLLNIMPCVFPILSLKALSLARAGESEGNARREAVAYTAGVILTCLALGGALLLIRAGGAAAGWAFQLQDPRVILLLLLLVLAIALNLAGLFELPMLGGGDSLAARGGTAGAFWTGALAAFVATPCTGPFMGAALGAALVLPTGAALAIFAGLGLGLALPFLMLGFLPPLRRMLPKPGPWMARFRHWMSAPMFLTAAALAWILSRQAGSEGLILGLAASLAVSIALWWIGRRHGRSWVPLLPATLVAIVAIWLVPVSVIPASLQGGTLAAQPFSETRLAELQADRRPVFVYFTADWCVTCKVNEKAVLDRDEVARAFEKKNVAVLVGDWTNGDAAISRFLERHGRSGVPLYLYYAPGKPPVVLPQLLTVGRMTDLVA